MTYSDDSNSTTNPYQTTSSYSAPTTITYDEPVNYAEEDRPARTYSDGQQVEAVVLNDTEPVVVNYPTNEDGIPMDD